AVPRALAADFRSAGAAAGACSGPLVATALLSAAGCGRSRSSARAPTEQTTTTNSNGHSERTKVRDMEDSWKLTVVSCQLTVGSGQLSIVYVSCQLCLQVPYNSPLTTVY